MYLLKNLLKKIKIFLVYYCFYYLRCYIYIIKQSEIMKTFTVQFVAFGSRQLQSSIVKAKSENQVNRFIIHKYGCVTNLTITEL